MSFSTDLLPPIKISFWYDNFVYFSRDPTVSEVHHQRAHFHRKCNSCQLWLIASPPMGRMEETGFIWRYFQFKFKFQNFGLLLDCSLTWVEGEREKQVCLQPLCSTPIQGWPQKLFKFSKVIKIGLIQYGPQSIGCYYSKT